ncbi:efflux RND transporter periplasmic adaptor subunit [Aliamphritea spongicola]|uniref:efflux RND transporter periplasmic adaptor subunit n=1 Tax=Aliamphritea spongicola TaxID=707589 RepID=UPI00196A4A94|nr:efflux RND transporter periplasmic adaptor subunit [Aliamphritea spongicola]MBN3562708.1 efflux RND transporter periplasmic adaptor subunit [Aliamphritea spongicola]
MMRAVKNFSLVLVGAVIGTAAATAVVPYVKSQLGMADMVGMADSSGSDSQEPLYWVAPMDPNYRRDKPGLSPMGMELVPFYGEEKKAKPKEPLYWVAPMDPNFRRDKPGLSPMGMDLVPFYGDEGGDDSGPGTVSISSEVVNNLGVRTASARVSPLEFKVDTVGYVQYNQDEMVHVHPRVEGWLEKVYVKSAGETVEKDQPLYELYSPELVNAQEELLFALSRKDRRLIKAAERRLSALQVPEAAVKTLKKTRKVVQTVTFHAPMTGVVENFAMQEGFFVKPGKMLMSIASLDEVWIEAEVFERQANLVKQDAPVTIRLDYLPGKTWQGKVDYVYPTLDKMNRTLRVRIRFPNPGLMLKPNMYAQVVISNLSDKPVLNIPREALIRVGDTDRVVLALGEGRYKSVNVVAGRNDGNRVEILEGIGKNEQVVTSAQFLLDSESSKTSDFKRMHQPESMSADMKMNMPNDGRAMSGDMKMKMPNDGRAMSGDMKMTMAHDGHDMSGDMKMNMAHDGHDMSAANSAEASATKIWTTAKVNKLLANGRRVNLKHGAVETWNWPPANMNLGLAETVSSKELRPGMDIAIEITRTVAGIYVITDVELPDDIGLPVVQEK